MCDLERPSYTCWVWQCQNIAVLEGLLQHIREKGWGIPGQAYADIINAFLVCGRTNQAVAWAQEVQEKGIPVSRSTRQLIKSLSPAKTVPDAHPVAAHRPLPQSLYRV